MKTIKFVYGIALLALSGTVVYALAPMENIDDLPVYGMNSGNIPEGHRSGGGVWNANIGDNVYIYTEIPESSSAANAHGIYGNASNATTGGNGIKIDVSGTDGDGIRSNPGGMSNGQNSNCTFVLGDDLTVWVRGESGDAVNLNGTSTLTVGDNAKFYAYGTLRSSGNSSYGLRANFGSKITTGKNTYIETTAENGHAIFMPTGLFTNNPQNSEVTLGDGANILTKGKGASGVYMQARYATTSFLGDATITTEGAGAHGIYMTSANGNVSIAGAAEILLNGDSSHGIYTSGASGVVSLGTSTTIDTLGTGGHAIYAYNGTIQGSGQFLLGTKSGKESIQARTGTVDLEMNKSSVFYGYTNIETTGKINLKMSDKSIWKLTESSNLTRLETASNSKIIFSVGGRDDFTSIKAAEALLNDSVMKVVLDGYNPILDDEFKLVDASILGGNSITFDFSEAVLDEGLEWDTSTFLTDGIIRVIAAVPVPEPLTASAFAGVVALAFAAYRRRK